MPKTMILFGGLHSTETSLAKVSNSHWKPGHRGFEANVYSLNSTNKLIFSVVLPQWNCIGICHRIYSACAADQIAFSIYQSCLCFVPYHFSLLPATNYIFRIRMVCLALSALRFGFKLNSTGAENQRTEHPSAAFSREYCTKVQFTFRLVFVNYGKAFRMIRSDVRSTCKSYEADEMGSLIWMPCECAHCISILRLFSIHGFLMIE